AVRQVCNRQLSDIAHGKMFVTPVCGITCAFLLIDVIGKKAGPFIPQARSGHSAACEEFVEGWHDHTLPLNSGHFSAMYCSLASRTTQANDTFFSRAMSSSVW